MEAQERKKSMKRCKITAVRKTEYKDLMEKYENPIQHACDIEDKCLSQKDGNDQKDFVKVHGRVFHHLL